MFTSSNTDRPTEEKSRHAELYKHLLAKEDGRSFLEEKGLPVLASASDSSQPSNRLSDIGFSDFPKVPLKKQVVEVSSFSPKVSHTVISNSVKKPTGAKRSGKTGGLGARKLTTKVLFRKQVIA